MRILKVVLVAVWLIGCGDATAVEQDAAVADSAPSADSGVDTASADTAAPIVWSACATDEWSQFPLPVTGVECTQFDVPLYQGATETITITVARLPATNGSGKAIFFPAGGPGGSSVEISGTIPIYLAGLTDTHDMVFVDQRGAGESGYLGCAAGDPRTGAEFSLCHDEHASKPLEHYLSINAADDIEFVRQRLGYGKISLRGGSYGTRVTLEYLRRHGAHAESVVLDGVAPPNYDYFGQVVVQNDEAMVALINQCEADSTCLAVSPDLEGDLATLKQGLPVLISVGGQSGMLTVDLFHAVLGQWLGNPAARYQIPRLIHDYVSGDPAPFYAALSVLFGTTVEGPPTRSDPVPGAAWSPSPPTLGRSNISPGVFINVLCSENLLNAGDVSDLVALEAMQTYGTATASDLATACTKWTQPFDAALTQPVTSSVPALLLSGALDTITPPKWADAALLSLSQGTHLVVPHTGHSTVSQPCVRSIINHFVKNGGAVGDTSCLGQIAQPPW